VPTCNEVVDGGPSAPLRRTSQETDPPGHAALAAAALPAAEIWMLRREGRNLDDASVSTLAFATTDWEGMVPDASAPR
jgi:hypothetical protein